MLEWPSRSCTTLGWIFEASMWDWRDCGEDCEASPSIPLGNLGSGVRLGFWAGAGEPSAWVDDVANRHRPGYRAGRQFFGLYQPASVAVPQRPTGGRAIRSPPRPALGFFSRVWCRASVCLVAGYNCQLRVVEVDGSPANSG